MAPRIIGQNGSSYLLVDESVPREAMKSDVVGRVYDEDRDILYPPDRAASIIKMSVGYEEHIESVDETADRLQTADVRGPPKDTIGTIGPDEADAVNEEERRRKNESERKDRTTEP